MNAPSSSSSYLSTTTASGATKPEQGRAQVDATSRIPGAGERALVLAGGGSTGNAWEIGVIAGLSDAGLDVTNADLTVGTSGGSTAAAQITSGIRPTVLFADIVATAAQPTASQSGSRPERGSVAAAADILDQTSRIIAGAEDAADMRRRMGAAALDMDAASDGSVQAQWHTTVAARLPSHEWPHQSLLVVAVDARTGEPVVFDRHSGVGLVDAVAASTSNVGAPPYSIDGNRYINGGYRRNENADLAAGFARVLVLSPFGGRSRHPLEWRMHLEAQVEELRAHGSRVETVFPDSSSGHIGATAMDLSLRPIAAQSGYDQGRSLVERLAIFWR